MECTQESGIFYWGVHFPESDSSTTDVAVNFDPIRCVVLCRIPKDNFRIIPTEVMDGAGGSSKNAPKEDLLRSEHDDASG